MDSDSISQQMMHGVSLIGKARMMHSSSPAAALEELNRAISAINKAVEENPENLENRKERLKHFLGLTMDSPLDLSDVVKSELDFFRSKIKNLSSRDKSFYYFILGQYQIHKGLRDPGVSNLENCIALAPSTLEACEARITLDSINSNI